MTTSLNTFEDRLRTTLTGILYGQWRALGAAIGDVVHPEQEVIDPEALAWATLFLSRGEPRLTEVLQIWLYKHRDFFLHQRFTSALTTDAQRARWTHFNSDRLSALNIDNGKPIDGPDRFMNMRQSRAAKAEFASRLGKISRRPSTLLIRARDVFAGDSRHFLMTYLMGCTEDTPLRHAAAWSRYSYRTLSTAASRLENAGIIEVERGRCRLLKPSTWWDTFSLKQDVPLAIIDWFDVFAACDNLLQVIARAREVGFEPANPALQGRVRGTSEALRKALYTRCPAPTLDVLRKTCDGLLD